MIDYNVFEEPSAQRISPSRSHRIVAHSESEVSHYDVACRNIDRKITYTDTVAGS